MMTALGFGWGVGVRIFANKLGKQRAFARPWEVVGFGMIGAYVGYNYKAWEQELLAAVNEKRVERGWVPLTGKESVLDINDK